MDGCWLLIGVVSLSILFAVFLNLAAMPFGFLVVTNAYKNDVSRVFRHNTLVVLTHDLTYCR